MLSGEEIEKLGLVVGATAEGYRASTYDVRIGEIVASDSLKKRVPHAAYVLPPGGMVRVISEELLTLNSTVTGHVLLKNALCRVGVLAIHIGVVDPGYEGPLSTTLINFGRLDYLVELGAPFLRVSFDECPASPRAAASAKWNKKAYSEQVRLEVLAHAAPTFLDVEGTAEKAADKIYSKSKKQLVLWSAIAALVFAAFTILVPVGAAYADRYLANREKREIEQRVKLEEHYEQQIRTLQGQVGILQRDAMKSAPANAPLGKP